MPGKTIRKPAPPAAPAGRERRKETGLNFGGEVDTGKKHAFSFCFSFFFFTFFFLSPISLPGKDLVRIKSPSPCACFAERDAVTECALELRRIGDKADLRQKVLNLITKLFCRKT
uniref:Phorbol-12-myristate-13-acetate-induced protein 1 n=1 Tax=Pavo cristatus TaxID=9049 RepID=A0A8C9F456_PAVCR